MYNLFFSLVSVIYRVQVRVRVSFSIRFGFSTWVGLRIHFVVEASISIEDRVGFWVCVEIWVAFSANFGGRFSSRVSFEVRAVFRVWGTLTLL